MTTKEGNDSNMDVSDFTLSSAIRIRKLRSRISASVYLACLMFLVPGVRPKMFSRCCGVDTEREIRSPIASWKPVVTN